MEMWPIRRNRNAESWEERYDRISPLHTHVKGVKVICWFRSDILKNNIQQHFKFKEIFTSSLKSTHFKCYPKQFPGVPTREIITTQRPGQLRDKSDFLQQCEMISWLLVSHSPSRSIGIPLPLSTTEKHARY